MGGVGYGISPKEFVPLIKVWMAATRHLCSIVASRMDSGCEHHQDVLKVILEELKDIAAARLHGIEELYDLHDFPKDGGNLDIHNSVTAVVTLHQEGTIFSDIDFFYE